MVRVRSKLCAVPAQLKEASLWWMGCWTVQVQLPSETIVTGGNSRTSVRRKRGLRKGKARSRGGKPRLIAPDRPPRSNVCTERKIVRIVRNLDFWQAKLDALGKAVKQAPRGGWADDGRRPTGRAYWLRFSLSRLNRGLKRHGSELAPLVVPSVSYFVEKHTREVVSFGGAHVASSFEVLDEWLYRFETSKREARLEAEQGARRRALVEFARRNLGSFPDGRSINLVSSSESTPYGQLLINPELARMGTVYLCTCYQYFLARGMRCEYCGRFERGDPERLVYQRVEPASARPPRRGSRR